MTPAENITREMGGKWHGSYGLIPTPGHSDNDRGTKVADADDGGVTFHSYNGSGDEWRLLKDECRRRGLLPHRAAREGWRETGTHEFTDEASAVLYRTIRHEHPGEPKRFVAERPSAVGGWIKGLGGARRVLYRLPDLLASDPAAPVYFVEGERKADKLAGWGLVATTIAFGAKGWRREYADHLAGRRVNILPDNDEPGGEFAAKVKAAVDAAGGENVRQTG